MFEYKPIPMPDSRDCAADAVAESALCELNWAELTARLAAARELRAELAHSNAAVLASFNAHSARHLASQHDVFRDRDSQPDVNPDDLGNGKGHAAEHIARDDRETPAPEEIHD